MLHSIVYYYTGAEKYEQFLQMCQLYWSVLSWFSSLSSKRLCVFSFHGAIYTYIKKIFVYILLFTF